MSWLQAFVLGLVQGLTEFLPISSSGHLALAPKLFGWQDQGLAFDVFLHGGTFLAVLLFFRRDWLKIFKALVFWKNEDGKGEKHLTFLIIIGIIPAIAAGFFLENLVRNQWRLPLLIGINLIFWSLILGLADFWAHKRKNTSQKLSELSLPKAFVIGLFQAISVLPGGSRSGLSITGGLFCRLDRRSAVKFSFLMSAPLILGAVIFESFNLVKSASSFSLEIPSLILGLISAFLSGLLAIKLLTYLARRRNFLPFVIYRIILGIVILVFLV